MGKRRSMLRRKKHDDASSMKTITPCENGGGATLSDITDDILLLVMMKLEVVDFLSFGRVCKSWRSLAVSNRNKFLVSRPPISISSSCANGKRDYYLEDIQGRKLKTILPHSWKGRCVGVTCGYLILCGYLDILGKKTRDFWLVNPITRHELHFPNIPFNDGYVGENFRGILVFSPLISEWVFVVFNSFYGKKIWFSIAGKGVWTKRSTQFPTNDLIACKGKIYTLHSIYLSYDYEVVLCEMKLFPEPRFVLLRTKGFPKPNFRCPGFASSGENLYVVDVFSEHPYKIHEIDLDEMKWVSHEKTGAKYTFFLSYNIYTRSCVDVRVAWVDTRSLYKRYAVNVEGPKRKNYNVKMWYFFRECFNINLLHE